MLDNKIKRNIGAKEMLDNNIIISHSNGCSVFFFIILNFSFNIIKCIAWFIMPFFLKKSLLVEEKPWLIDPDINGKHWIVRDKNIEIVIFFILRI